VSADYATFLDHKTQGYGDAGFDPVWMPEFLFPFQRSVVEWAMRKGRAAIFADCGMGKTPMQLVWAENVVRRTAGRVLIVTPLAVAWQTVEEGEKFGVEVRYSKDGKPHGDITVTNYDRLHQFDRADYVAVVADESSRSTEYVGRW
jgi:hypothetical protein